MNSSPFHHSLFDIDVPLTVPTTPFPNLLLDALMPQLKDTEWRLLCVIVRQTLGWHRRKPTHNGQTHSQGSQQESRRKAFDWITQQQLQEKTGRASAALSRALEVLVQNQLVEAWSAQGRLLKTAQERRCGTRIYYRLHPRLLSQVPLDAQAVSTPALSTAAAASSPPELSTPLSTPSLQSEVETAPTSSTSEVPKAKTTKERNTKEIPSGRDQKSSFKGQETRRPEPAQRSRVTTRHSTSPVQQFLRHYRNRFQQRTRYGEPPVIHWGRDGKLVKELLQLYSYERLVKLLDQFFALEDAWIRQRGYSLAAFKATISQLLVNEGYHHREEEHRPVIRTGGWTRASQTATPQQRRFPSKQ